MLDHRLGELQFQFLVGVLIASGAVDGPIDDDLPVLALRKRQPHQSAVFTSRHDHPDGFHFGPSPDEIGQQAPDAEQQFVTGRAHHDLVRARDHVDLAALAHGHFVDHALDGAMQVEDGAGQRCIVIAHRETHQAFERHVRLADLPYRTFDELARVSRDELGGVVQIGVGQRQGNPQFARELVIDIRDRFEPLQLLLPAQVTGDEHPPAKPGFQFRR